MSILLTMLLIGIQAQSSPSSAAVAAERFALDLPVDDTVAVPSAALEPALSPDRRADVPAAAPVAGGAFSLDTPIALLIADPRARAILDRDVPGLSEDENLPTIRALSLRELAPLSGGQMTAALLDTVGADLAAIGSTAPPPKKAMPARRALPIGR